MDYAKERQKIIDDKDNFIKKYGKKQYNKAVGYYTRKANYTGLNGISSSMDEYDGLISNAQKRDEFLKTYGQDQYEQALEYYGNKADEDLNTALGTYQNLTKTRAKTSTLDRYGVQYQYDPNSYEDKIAKLAGLAPASFDISKYLPSGMQANDTMYTDDGASAVLDDYLKRQKTESAFIGGKEFKAAQVAGMSKVEPTGIGAAQTGAMAANSAIYTQQKNKETKDYYTGYNIGDAQTQIADLEQKYAAAQKNIQWAKDGLDSDVTLTGDKYYGDLFNQYTVEADQIQKKIAQLKTDIELTNYYGFMNNMDSADFEALQQKGQTLGMFSSMATNYSGESDNKMAYMSPDETKVYYYLLAKDQKQADAFMATMDPILKRRVQGEWDTSIAQLAKDKPVESSIGSLFLAPFAGVGYVDAGIKQMTGQQIDTTDSIYAPARDVNTIRNSVSENMTDAEKFLYNTGMSMGDFIISTGISVGSEPVALAMMSTNAATNAMLDAFDRGASQEQAVKYGFLVGAAEAVFEKISLGNFIKIAGGGGGKTVMNILKQGGIEASEEVATEVANFITDSVVMGDMSQYNQLVNQYVQSGKSQAESETQASKDMLMQVAMSGAGGLLSGGVMGGIGSIASGVQTNGNGELNIPQLPDISQYAPTTEPVDTNINKQTKAPQNGLEPNGTRIHETAKSLLEAYADTEFGQMIASDIESGKASYTPQSAEADLAKAMNDVQSGRLTADNYDSPIGDNGEIKKYNKTDVVRMIALIDEAVQNGDTQTQEELTAAAYEMGLQLGRAVQAFSLLKKATPAGHLAAIQREIARVNAEGIKKFPADRNGKSKWVNLALTADETAAILNAPTFEGRMAEYEKAQERMKGLMPSTTWEKLDQIRKTGMLLNFKSQVRNIGGNVANMAVTGIARKVEAAIQKILPQEQRTVVGFIKPEYRQMAKGDFNNVIDAYKNNGRYNIEAKLGQGYQQAFKNKGFGKALNNLSKATGWALDLGDVIFGKHHYETALASYMQAQNLTEITGPARAYAMERALEATFRSDSKAANAINALIKKGGVGGKALSIIMPFVKTPINIAKQSFDYSALGLGKSLIVDTIRVKKGTLSATQYIHNLSKGLTGTAISALGFMLAKGLLVPGVKITGGAPDDKDEEQFMRSQGWQPYSLQIGDTYVPISWAQPAASTLLMGVKVADLVGTGEDFDVLADTAEIAGVLFDSIAEISPLSGVQKTLQYSNGIEDIAVGIASDLAGQFVPAIAKQAVQTIDPKIYDQYTSNPLETIKNQYAVGLGAESMGINLDVAQKVDPWGKPITQPDNFAARAGMNLLSPANLSFGSDDEVNNEISRLFESTGKANIFPPLYDQREIKTSDVLEITGQPIKLTAEELQQMQEGIGQSSRVLVEQYMKSDAYRTASDEERAKTISGYYTDVKTLFELSKAYGVSPDKVLAQVKAQSKAYFNGENSNPVPDARILAGDYLNGVDEQIRSMLKSMYDGTGDESYLLTDDTFSYRGKTYEYPKDMQSAVVEGYTPEYGGDAIPGIDDIIGSSFFKQEDEDVREKIISDTISSIMDAIEKDTVRTQDPLATVQEDKQPDTATYYGFNDYWKEYGTSDKVVSQLDELGVYPNNSKSFSSADLPSGTHDWTDDERQMIANATHAALLKYSSRLDFASAEKIIDRVYLAFKNYVIDGRELNPDSILNDVYTYMDEKYEW